MCRVDFDKYLILFYGFYQIIVTVIIYILEYIYIYVRQYSENFTRYYYHYNGLEVYTLQVSVYLLHAHRYTLKIRCIDIDF